MYLTPTRRFWPRSKPEMLKVRKNTCSPHICDVENELEALRENEEKKAAPKEAI